MDKTAWKISDPEWVKQREAIWPKFEKFLSRFAKSDDGDPVKFMRNARDFYDGVDLEYPIDPVLSLSFPDWMLLVVLHPAPTVENIREIYADWSSKSSGEKGYYGHYFLSVHLFWVRLIVDGVLTKSVGENFMEAIYGNTLDEACQIQGCDIVKTLFPTIESTLGQLMKWSIQNMEADYIPYERLLVQLMGMLLLVDDAVFDKLEFGLKRTFRTIYNFDTSETAHLPGRMDFINKFKAALIENRDKLNPRFWPYIDQLT